MKQMLKETWKVLKTAVYLDRVALVLSVWFVENFLYFVYGPHSDAFVAIYAINITVFANILVTAHRRYGHWKDFVRLSLEWILRK